MTDGLSSLTLRAYRPTDAASLLALFRDTVRRVNARDYDARQIAAWASDEIDPAAWAARFHERFAVVAVERLTGGSAGEQLAGFTDLEPDGHLDRLFVSAEHQRRGVGRMLLAAAISEARRLGLPRMFTEASITARPFFAAHGFTLLAEQTVVCRGAELKNFRMELRLDS